MISLVKVIIEHFSKLLGKRGELRNKDVLLAPKLSSSIRISEFLSSCVLLLKKLVNYSHILLRVSVDPRVKPEGDRKESVFEGGGRWKNAPEGDNLYKVMPRFGTNRPGIFELTKKKIGRSLDVFWRKRGMTINVIVLFLFLLFPNVSYSAVYFLPDAQWDNPINVSIDSSQCEDAGYTYYSSGECPPYHNQETCVFMDQYLKCDGTGWCMDNGYTLSSCPNPKVLNTQCPNGYSLYKYCVCPSTYKYVCSGTGYGGGSGVICDGKYTSCACSTNYVWSGTACVCDSAFNYTCSGTGYNSGSGASCGGKYKSCNCSTYYSWNGSACAHVHSYVCPSGYSTSNSGMVEPTSTAKVCQLSGCSSTSGTCYKETHVHSYACASGYSTSCSNGYSASSAKTCSHSSCSATSGTCYKCCADTYKYTCSGTGYSSGSGTACSGKYTSCNCASGYHWTGSACVAHSYSCPSGYSTSCSNGYSGTASKVCSCSATSGTCYKCCADTYKYACSGTGYASGSGTACSDKYTSCNCVDGYEWNGSACVLSCSDSTCSVGNILYSDMTCCKDVLSNKTAVGVIVKDNALVMSPISSSTMKWASADIDVSGITNITVIQTYVDYNGKANTLAIVSAHPSDTTSNNAAVYCNSYSTAGTSVGDWYLPAGGELYDSIYRNGNYSVIDATISKFGWSFGTGRLWISSEYSYSGSYVLNFNADEGENIEFSSKQYSGSYVSCFLPFSVNNGIVTPCDTEYKYSCSGTGYASGSGTACSGMYKSCNCANLYSWSGSACTHSHSYSCPSGYSTSCSNGYSGTASKVCSCSATSGTCYKCCADTYKYACSGTGYASGSGTACNGKYTACTCASGYTWDSASGTCKLSCSSSNWCPACQICHGNCCTDGTYDPCSSKCSALGYCSSSSSSSSSSGGDDFDGYSTSCSDSTYCSGNCSAISCEQAKSSCLSRGGSVFGYSSCSLSSGCVTAYCH